MGQLSNSAIGSYASDYQYRTEQTKKNEGANKTTKVPGKTIGEPKLSEDALKYYESLKKKYSNMEFILVSPDKKEEAERNKGMYQSDKELIVLIDSNKIEKMAKDKAYREKYENILNGATAQMTQMKTELGSNADSVSSFGMTFDDHGNASFFAVIDKSLAAQRERITEKKAEAVKEKKAEAKKEAAERAKDKQAENAKEKKAEDADKVTVTASTWDELLKKIDAIVFGVRSDNVMTDAEKAVGSSFDFSI